MAFTQWGPAAPLGLVASTPQAGFALQNGTPAILSWTAPADGRNHRVLVVGALDVTTAETGGACTLSFTTPNGAALTSVIIGGGVAAGYHGLTNVVFPIQSGSTISLQQTTALTAGAAVVFVEFWGS